MELRIYGYMELRIYGYMELWIYGLWIYGLWIYGLWIYGAMDIRGYGDIRGGGIGYLERVSEAGIVQCHRIKIKYGGV
ncbi:MAG TPA: hypothetical protein VF490_17260 [Chryseosolibacter sp.]